MYLYQRKRNLSCESDFETCPSSCLASTLLPLLQLKGKGVGQFINSCFQWVLHCKKCPPQVHTMFYFIYTVYGSTRSGVCNLLDQKSHFVPFSTNCFCLEPQNIFDSLIAYKVVYIVTSDKKLVFLHLLFITL